jgi:hypothetical protein
MALEVETLQSILRAQVGQPAVLTAGEILGLRIADLARLFGVAHTTIRDWSTRRHPMPPGRELYAMVHVAQAINVLGLRDAPTPEEAARQDLILEAAVRMLILAVREFGVEELRKHNAPAFLDHFGIQGADAFKKACELVLAEDD